MKQKRHEIVLVIRADKPCTKAFAINMVKKLVHGEFYPHSWEDEDPETFRIVGCKGSLS